MKYFDAVSAGTFCWCTDGSKFVTTQILSFTPISSTCQTDRFSEWRRFFGKIQGDGRKFLDRFKSNFGSQISSQSLNDDDCFYTALFSALEQTHCARKWFVWGPYQPITAEIRNKRWFFFSYIYFTQYGNTLPCQRLKTRVRVELLVKKWFSPICFALLLILMSDIIMSEDHFVASNCIFTAALQYRSSDCKAKWSFFFFIWLFVGFACIAPT